MQKIDYRKAVNQDISDLINLRIQQLKDEGYPETKNIQADLHEYFLNNMSNNTLLCWVGTFENRIIATAGLCIYQLPPTFSNPSGKIAYLTNVYTADEYRKKGIASYLIETLLNEAKTRNFSAVRLHASQLGQSVYKKLGFIETSGYMDLKFWIHSSVYKRNTEVLSKKRNQEMTPTFKISISRFQTIRHLPVSFLN